MPTNPPPCKTFKTFEEQAKLLITRHLEASKDDLICRLKAVNYYRLTGYLHIFRETKQIIRVTEPKRMTTAMEQRLTLCGSIIFLTEG